MRRTGRRHGRIRPGGARLLPGDFLSVLVLLGPLIVFVWRVIPLPEEVRLRLHHHHGAH